MLKCFSDSLVCLPVDTAIGFIIAFQLMVDIQSAKLDAKKLTLLANQTAPNNAAFAIIAATFTTVGNNIRCKT